MASINRKAIKKLAAKQTADRASYKEIFLHTLVSLGVAVMLIALDYVLQAQIGGTGSLSGLGTRSVLETVRMVLQYANMLLLPFWEIGILYWAIRRTRGQETGFRSFAEGFRRFGAVFRLKLIQGIVTGSIYMFCAFVSSLIFTLSPLGWPMVRFVMSYTDDPTALLAMSDEALMGQLMQYMWPVFIILALLLIPAMMPLYYRFRMADYVIMDKPRTGALYALYRSFQITKKQFFPLFKLDASFWWFWALQFLASAGLYLDLVLTMMGVTALDANTLILLSYVTGYSIQFISYTLFRGRVETAYALTYNALNASVPEPKPLIVQTHTWNEQ